MSRAQAIAYKVLTSAQRQALLDDRVFGGAPADLADGFIHLSTANQLAGTLDRHFAGQSDLFVASVELASLGGTVRWEEARGGQLFPHVYGPLPLSAVIACGPLDRDEDGKVKLPVAGR